MKNVINALGWFCLLSILAACDTGSEYNATSTGQVDLPVSVIEQTQGILGRTVMLDGRNSNDPNGNILEYNWSFTSRPAGSSALIVNARSAVASFVPDLPGNYIVSLVVSNASNDSLPAEITISVETIAIANTAPVANAGQDFNVNTGSPVELNGAGSSDADGDTLQYHWLLIDKPANSTAVLSASTSVSPSFTPDMDGIYVIHLMVNDGTEDSNPDLVQINATTPAAGNTPPVANAGNDLNTMINNTVVLNGSNSFDANLDSISYQWRFSSRPGNSSASINNATSMMASFIPDVAGNYIVQLVVNDGQTDSNPDFATVTAASPNSAPTANAGNDLLIPLGTTATLDGRASSDANGDPLSYQWRLLSKPAGSNSNLINAATSRPQLTPDLFGDYLVQLIVNDGSLNSLADTMTVSTSVSCESQKSRFQQNTWPVLRDNCRACHQDGGVTSPFNLVDENTPGYNDINFNMFKTISDKRDVNNVSVMLSKSSNSNGDHGGGQRFSTTDSRYLALEDMVERLSGCTGGTGQTSGGIELLSPYAWLRKTTLSLAGRLPASTEENSVAAAVTGNDVENAMNSIIADVLTEAAFHDRLKEIYNDLLLVKAFSIDESLEFDFTNFNNGSYFDSANLTAQGYSASDARRIRVGAFRGIRNSPLELISHVVKNNRPFTEILTADYILVNPYTAKLHDLTFTDGFEFRYGETAAANDDGSFREARLVDNNGKSYPHAGLLTTPVFLNRYPTTNTNRNRARSRYIFRYFLDTDVEGLADRGGLDLDNQIGEFPTFQDPQCKQCHDVVDPIAGLFKNWTERGRYLGNNTSWYSEITPRQMVSPGFSTATADRLPAGDGERALQWMAGRIATDNRFAVATVKTLFQGIIGRQATDSDTALVENLKADFVSSNFNLKTLVKGLVNSTAFRAANLEAGANPQLFSGTGSARLLTPEQLNRKVISVLNGYEWRAPSNNTLRSATSYMLLYGGINSKDITRRTTDPTAIMRGIQERIALQSSCENVPLDFSFSAGSRILFPHVEISDTPATTGGTNRIRQNIVYLHKHILGEVLDSSNSEVTRTYNLFVDAMNASTGSNIPAACNGSLASNDPIRVDSNGTVRAWMAVVSYMLYDYRFLYE